MWIKKPKAIDPRLLAPEESAAGRLIREGLRKGLGALAEPGPNPIDQGVRGVPRVLREGFNRKFSGKGSDYTPGTRVPAIEESLYDLDDDLG